MIKTYTILGAGAWGTAIAHLLAEHGNNVVLWCHETDCADEINRDHTNSSYLPGVPLPSSIYATASLEEALLNAPIIFEAIPVAFLRSVMERASDYTHQSQTWVILSKGIEQATLKFPSEIINEVLNTSPRMVVLGGPNFARELVEGALSGTIVASAPADLNARQDVMRALSTSYFITYPSDDILGVQLCGALKNVIALAVGIALGAHGSTNTRSLLITQGLHEIARLAHVYGADPMTVYGLAGLGDLVLTSTSLLSKNMSLGKKIGEGSLLRDIEQEGTLPEGINTLKSVYQLINKHQLDLPVISATYQIIFNNAPLSTLVEKIQGINSTNQQEGARARTI